ncbi:hypothetical protein MKX03_022398 [Papaver bracteatum]|nr:hypothetical protein MKX03_022398 [Papaver bracteatum]
MLLLKRWDMIQSQAVRRVTLNLWTGMRDSDPGSLGKSIGSSMLSRKAMAKSQAQNEHSRRLANRFNIPIMRNITSLMPVGCCYNNLSRNWADHWDKQDWEDKV